MIFAPVSRLRLQVLCETTGSALRALPTPHIVRHVHRLAAGILVASVVAVSSAGAATSTPTPRSTATPTRTPTPTRTATPSRTPTATRTPTLTPTPTRTATNTAPPTVTRTPTRTPIDTFTTSPTRTVTDTPSPCPAATPEPLWVDPLVSPTTQLSAVVTVYAGNADVVGVNTESGAFSVTGDFSTAHPAQVTISLLPKTTHHLEVAAHVRTVHDAGGCTYGGYLLRTTTDRFGGPLIIDQSGMPPAATATPSGTLSPATATPTRTPSGTPPTVTACAGDCNGNRAVTIDEILIGVDVALGRRALGQCPAFAAPDAGAVTIADLVRAVASALSGCRAP